MKEKTRDELVSELEELQYKYNSLQRKFDQDLIEPKLTEAKLKQSENLLRLVADHLPAFVAYVTAPDLIYRFINHKYEISFQLPKEQIIGHSVAEILSQANYEFARPFINRALNGESCSYENTFSFQDGQHWIQVNFVPHSNESGVVNGIVILNFDLTERKQAEDELRESELRFRNVADNSPVLIWKSDTDALCDYFNQPWLDFTGRSMKQEIGNGWAEGVHPEDFQHCLDIYLNSFNARQPFQMEYRLRRYDGEYRWLLDNGVPRFLQNGAFAGYIGSCVDITEWNQAKYELLVSEKKYRNLFEKSQVGMFRTRIDGSKVLDVNNKLLRAFGCTHEEMIGNPSTIRYHNPEQRKELIKLLQLNGFVSDFEAEMVTKDGSIITTIMSIESYPDDGILEGSFIDITERKRTEESLLRIMKAVESTGDAIGISDALGHHFYQNRALSELFEYETAEELEEAGGGAAVIKDPQVARQMFENIMSGRSWTGELEMVTKSGRIFPAYERADAIKDNAGNIIGLIGIISDITERKLGEQKILTLNETLEERVKERTKDLELANKELNFHLKEIEQFNYITTHDLTEPLMTLTNFTRLLHEEYAGKLDEDGNKSIDFIFHSANRMRLLLKNLLEYSLLGKDSIRTVVDCNKMVSEVMDELNGPVKESNAEIILQDLPTVSAYSTELRFLFQHLISNAIKFRKKEIRPEINISAENQEKEWVFSIADNGIGIKEKDKEKIFMIFQRMVKHDEFDGTGIGLAQCKKIVEIHGGRIWVESNTNGGSTFRFTIGVSG